MEICGQRGKLFLDMSLALRDTGKIRGLCIIWVHAYLKNITQNTKTVL